MLHSTSLAVTRKSDCVDTCMAIISQNPVLAHTGILGFNWLITACIGQIRALSGVKGFNESA